MKTLILLIIITLFSCQQEDVKKLSSQLEIGQEYNNGIIFYIFNENDKEYVNNEQHGYIVSNYIGSYTWGCTNVPLVQLNVEGKYNTEIIIASCGSNNAAGQLNAQEWWLPSLEEWELLMASNVLKTYEMPDYYWTSTKSSYNEALAYRPSDEDIAKKSVNNTLKCIGIKQF